MFFVIVGVVILFASFVIALVSLIREQNGQDVAQEPQMTLPVTPGGQVQDQPPQEEAVVSGSPVQAQEVERVDMVTEPFPWEVNLVRQEEPQAQISKPTVVASRLSGSMDHHLSGEISIRRPEK